MIVLSCIDSEGDMSGLADRGDNERAKLVTEIGYERFQKALLSGELRPGDFVSQKELAIRLALSVGALRELIPRLHYEGLLTVQPQRGIQITPINLPTIHEAFQMRLALEREAVITAVERLPGKVIERQRELHQRFLEENQRADMSEILKPETLKKSRRIDDEFHKCLIENCENGLISKAYQINAMRSRLLRLYLVRSTVAAQAGVFADHLAIIEAIAKRDRAAAVDAVERHLRNAKSRALEYFL